MSNVIHLDVDGVLLNWRDTFVTWLKKYEMISEDDATSYYFDDLIKIPGHPEYTLKNGTFRQVLSEIFNDSHYLEKLPPEPNAVKSVKKLHEAGYDLKVVSSYTDSYEAMKKRERNLINVFGNIFSDITSLPLGSSKISYLRKQDKNSIFIEDSPAHLLDALEVGFSAENLYLMPQPWNLKLPHAFLDSYIKILNWNDITKNILGE